MTRQQSSRLPIPMLAHERVFLGIDVSKRRHVAGFVSTTLLHRHRRFESCPTLAFANTRAGFASLLAQIDALTSREQVAVLLEHTGHYHRDLQEFLLAEGLPVYIIHVQARAAGMTKSDARDALSLANMLYNQVEKEIQSPDRKAIARPAARNSAAAMRLTGLVRHHYELQTESTRRKNKLTAILDELFPEFAAVFKNPNLPTPRRLRASFPTPQAIAAASIDALRAAARPERPMDGKLFHLQVVAGESIGTRDEGRLSALTFEQGQLLAELALIERHLAALDAEIEAVVTTSREGQILLSLPRVGIHCAATLIAAIGTIRNFPNAASLKSYCGWAPKLTQTGTTKNSMALTRGGNHPVKRALYLAALGAIQADSEWKRLYERLLPQKCQWDPRIKDYRGKLKVIGRVCGQMLEVIYLLLRQDADYLDTLAEGKLPDPPRLYDAALHRRHRNGEYQKAGPRTEPPQKASVLRFPQKS